MNLTRILIAAAVMLAGWADAAPSSPPNIVLILVDDLGHGELGCQGNPQIPTPHIDSLARDGVRFTQAYVTSPVCSPSRAGLLTGRYQTRFGYEFNVIGRNNLDPLRGIPQGEKTLADRLKAAGYATGLVGKWHLGGTAAHHPLKRGFDEFFGFLHEGHFYVPPPHGGVATFLRTNRLPEGARGRLTQGGVTWSDHLGQNEPAYDEANPILRGTEPVTEPQHLTDAFTREALAFIDRHRARPFFLFLSHNAPHSPMQAAEKQMRRFGNIEDEHRRVFAGMVASLDESVGAVLGRLRKLGLEEQTLVLFLSDNGGPTAELTSSNAPFRGGKGQVWEGGIRVPFLAQWKKTLPAGVVFNEPVIATDIAATVLAAAGVHPRGDMDGVNLLPWLHGQQTGPPHETLHWRYGASRAVRAGDWKLVKQGDGRGAAPAWALFNLASDPAEADDVSADHPEIVRNLQRRFDDWNEQQAEPLWGGAARPQKIGAPR